MIIQYYSLPQLHNSITKHINVPNKIVACTLLMYLNTHEYFHKYHVLIFIIIVTRVIDYYT